MANNFQVFGTKAVLTVEPVMNADQSCATINLEMAPVRGKPIHAEKFIIQPTASELSLLSCVLLGLIPAFQLKRDGKWMSFERQRDNGCLFVKGGLHQVLALPVSAGDCFLLTDTVLSRLSENSKAPQMIELNLKSVAKLYLKKSEALIMSKA